MSNRRAWLAAGTVPVALLDVARDRLQVATVRDDVIVTHWVRVDELAPVVHETTAVSPSPGAPADPGTVVLPGFRLPLTLGPWIAIRSGAPLAITGFIPAQSRGTFWDELPDDPAAPTLATIGIELTVHAEPHANTLVRAVIHPGARARVLGRHLTGSPWFGVHARGGFVVVTGFVDPPQSPPTPASTDSEAECCAELDVEVPAPHGFWQRGACLYDRPGGAIVGEVIGDVTARPTPSADGWSSITVTTGWGEARYHAKTPILEPPPTQPARAEETFEWPYRNEYWR